MAEPIRVCQIVGNMMGGGVEHVVMNYFQHVDRSRVQFDFVITDTSIVVPREQIESGGGRIFSVPGYKNLPAFDSALFELFKAHPEWRIVHSHMNALSVFPLRQAERAGILVRIAHSHSAFGYGEPLRNAAKLFLRRFANKYPTNRFACSKTAGDWLFGEGTPYEVVYNAIDLARFAFDLEVRADTRLELGIPAGTFVVGHVGRFMQTKNQEFLVDAFAKMLPVRPDSRLVFAGTGEDEQAVRRLAESLGVSNKVLFLGQRDDSYRLYQAFDVVALPSLYEGLGLVAIEAQASGLPCLLSDRIPGEADLTGLCRYLPIKDSQMWADALAALEPRGGEARAGCDRADFTNYDVNNQAARLTDRYLELYEGAGR
jgi:glycosyltransferase involved in cell wall biosynthesis